MVLPALDQVQNFHDGLSCRSLTRHEPQLSRSRMSSYAVDRVYGRCAPHHALLSTGNFGRFFTRHRVRVSATPRRPRCLVCTGKMSVLYLCFLISRCGGNRTVRGSCPWIAAGRSPVPTFLDFSIGHRGQNGHSTAGSPYGGFHDWLDRCLLQREPRNHPINPSVGASSFRYNTSSTSPFDDAPCVPQATRSRSQTPPMLSYEHIAAPVALFGLLETSIIFPGGDVLGRSSLLR